MNKATESDAKLNLTIVGECDIELWSLNAAERHRRAFTQAGVHWAAQIDASDIKNVIAVRADYLLAQSLITALVARPNTVLTSEDGKVAVAAHASGQDLEAISELLSANAIDPAGATEVGIDLLSPDELGSNYDSVLRKRATPFVLSYAETSINVLEQKTFGAAYKGATDFVTKWCWPRPARWVTRWAAAQGISPNSVTTASLILVLLATWLFANGHFFIAIPIAWAMTFLDTVDGKLARVTITSSAWGNVYDHGIDLIHPPFWWWAWYVGALPTALATIEPLLGTALWIIVVGYVVGRLLELIFIVSFKVQTHIWRPIDYFFRTITARRNPNLAILTITTIAGYPDVGFIAVAGWTVISLIFHSVRLLQAAAVRMRGGEVVSWLTQEH